MQPVPVVRSTPVSGANRLDRSSANKTGGESFVALLSQQLSDNGASAQRPQRVTGTSVSVHGPEAKPSHATEARSPSTEGSRSPVAASKSGATKSQASAAQTASAPPVEKKTWVQGQPQVPDPSQTAGGMIGGGAAAAVAANPGANTSSPSGTISSQPATKKPSQGAQAGQMAVAALMTSPVGLPPAKPEQKTSPVPSETAVEGALFSSSGAGRTEQGPVGVQRNAEMTSSASGNEANFSLPMGANGTSPPPTGMETSSGQGSSDTLAVSLTTHSAHTVSGHSALDGLLMSPGGATVGAEMASSSVTTPLGQMGWGSEFSQKVTWMVGQSQQSAELHLNPPDLGPLSVVVQVSGAQADAFFSSPHAAVREAIQHALPHLREMLAGSGLSLGQATVSDQGARDSSSQRQMPSGNFSATKRTLEVSSGSMSVRGGVIRQGVGLVDTFA